MNKTVFSGIVTGILALGPADAQEWRSAYTDTDSSNCITLSVDPGYSAELACPGYKGYPLLIRDGDLRMFVSYGFDARDEMAAGQTMPNFNSIGEKLEWLIADDADLGEQPVASILRYHLDRSEGFIPDTQVLVVTRIEPGNTCHVAYIDALANRNANMLARQAAADLVPGWDCRTMEARRIGNPDPHSAD
ncbi:hypothetical protein [Pontibaca methylaminivorans]|uniref:hypothetical protein n=1 Tax=Pontibaca methylaminivorans TaxID=515897 RepID=UPI002FDA6F2A